MQREWRGSGGGESAVRVSCVDLEYLCGGYFTVTTRRMVSYTFRFCGLHGRSCDQLSILAAHRPCYDSLARAGGVWVLLFLQQEPLALVGCFWGGGDMAWEEGKVRKVEGREGKVREGKVL